MSAIIDRKLYLDQLINKKQNGLIKIITGIRRCGKSFLLFNLFYNHLIKSGVKESNIISLILDDDKNRKYRNPDNLSEYLYSRIKNKKEMYFILLDEVQFALKNDEIKNDNEIRLYGILNGLLRLDNVDMYITESNSKFLSSDVLTEFRGRGDEVRVYPLSFSEYYSSCANKDKLDVWNEYSMFGGMPALILKKTDEEKIKYLKDFINNTYIKDVIERNNIKNNTVIDSLFNILASSIGSLTNPTKLANTFKSNGIKVTDVTLSNYINMLKDSFIIEQAERYDIKGKKYINSPFKYYFTDIGLRNSRINYRQQEQTHIMENIIYNELIIRGFAVDVGIIEHTIRDKEKKQKQIQLEVDFVCNKGMNKYYIQSAFSIPNEEKMNQETSSLDKINDSFKKIIVTQDFGKPWKTEKGYLIINIIDFLLDSNSLDL